MRTLAALTIVVCLGACSGREPMSTSENDGRPQGPPLQSSEPAPAPQDGGRPQEPPTQPPAPQVDGRPQGPPTQPSEPAPAPAAEPDDKTLERTPGLTPPLPLVLAAAPTALPGLDGEPAASPAMGASDAEALVKVFVFSDFQCPVCRRAVEPLKKLVRAFPGEVQVVFKQHPLASHARAEPAARASLAAMAQGRFWEMHDRLFEAQRALEDHDLAAHAQALGLDLGAWKKALGDPKITAQIAYETAQAEALGARGTPAFVVNGVKTVGWGSYFGLEAQVKQALAAARELLDGGVPSAEVARRATADKDARAAEILFGAK